MHRVDVRDLLAGVLLVVAGAFMAVYAGLTLDAGTVRRLGPGMFPSAIGVLLVVFGLAIGIPALFRSGPELRLDLRPLVAIVVAVAAFGLILPRFGLVPAIIATTVISSCGESGFRATRIISLSVILPAIAAGIFHYGLGLALPLFRNPF